jgi:hypothetical protein
LPALCTTEAKRCISMGIKPIKVSRMLAGSYSSN